MAPAANTIGGINRVATLDCIASISFTDQSYFRIIAQYAGLLCPQLERGVVTIQSIDIRNYWWVCRNGFPEPESHGSGIDLRRIDAAPLKKSLLVRRVALRLNLVVLVTQSHNA
jgi:hypothetical protein